MQFLLSCLTRSPTLGLVSQLPFLQENTLLRVKTVKVTGTTNTCLNSFNGRVRESLVPSRFSLGSYETKPEAVSCKMMDVLKKT